MEVNPTRSISYTPTVRPIDLSKKHNLTRRKSAVPDVKRSKENKKEYQFVNGNYGIYMI
jgi:hypothetical protein